MEKRIKILLVFTIIAIIVFCISQFWWLYLRYDYTLQNYKNNLYERVLNIMQEEINIRRASQNQNISIVTNSQIKANNGQQHNSLTWVFEIYVADGSEYAIRDSSDYRKIIELYKEKRPNGIKKYDFAVSNRENEMDAYAALERFCINQRCPFSIEKLTELLEENNIRTTNITMEQADSMVWNPELIPQMSIRRPGMTVVYPCDILEGKVIRMTFDIGISPIIKEMSGTLIVTFFLSILLISCLVAQILTIRRQRKIETLRKDFIQTMVHELKRPISTLKMCVSYMRNDKLMQDSQSKEAIIADSYNELNNLSSYFSKLRDLTSDYISEIPLNLSSFSLEELVKECIAKLNISGSKKAEIRISADHDINITADRMHITNIVSNLLENAVKYSDKMVDIEVEYDDKDGTANIVVKDNGIGIPKSDIKYIFDKFYRSNAALKQNIPGLGLGLAYVNLLVNAHKGAVCVESEEGKGSVFTIKLPNDK